MKLLTLGLLGGAAYLLLRGKGGASTSVAPETALQPPAVPITTAAAPVAVASSGVAMPLDLGSAIPLTAAVSTGPATTPKPGDPCRVPATQTIGTWANDAVAGPGCYPFGPPVDGQPCYAATLGMTGFWYHGTCQPNFVYTAA